MEGENNSGADSKRNIKTAEKNHAGKGYSNNRKAALIGILSAISYALAFFEFQTPLSPAFARMDFSDFPALIAAFAISPASGVWVALIKNLLGLFTTATWGIGELANFLICSALILPAGFIYHGAKSKRRAIYGCLAGTVTMALVAGLLNYFVLLPMFSKFMPIDEIIGEFGKMLPFIKSKFDVIIYNAIPWNFIKGVIISIVTILVYKRISPIMKGEKL
jgi:riboflavin transporter FmnP